MKIYDSQKTIQDKMIYWLILVFSVLYLAYRLFRRFIQKDRRIGVTRLSKILIDQGQVDKIIEYSGCDTIHVNSVHRPHKFIHMIKHHYIWKHNGVFYDYLIRKYISNIQGIDGYDRRAHEKPYDSSSYMIYQKDRGNVLDILNEIWDVSQSHFLSFREQTRRYREDIIDRDNLIDVMDYIWKFPDIQSSILNPSFSCRLFRGDGDILCKDMIIDIKCNLSDSIITDDQSVFYSFIQLILYGTGHYINTGIKIDKFMIYNPILGKTFNIVCPDIDYPKIIELIENYC